MFAILASLRIRNLALAEDVFWEPAPGFNTISGETGAGKSLILGALNLILGERADRTIIRSGAESCTVEAEFRIDDSSQWNEILSERGAEPCTEGVCLIRRTFHLNGSSRNFMNGSPCTLSLLREVGKCLIDLHGPHNHQSLFSTQEQTHLLDAFAGALEQRKTVAHARRRFLWLLGKQTSLTADHQTIEREMDLLRYQTQEIFSARLVLDEEDKLLERQRVAANAHRIRQVAKELEHLIEGESGMNLLLSNTLRALRDWVRLDTRAELLLKLHTEISERVDEWIRQIRDLSSEEESDSTDLRHIEERIDLLQLLKRKYGSSVGEILMFAEKSQARLDELINRESRKNNLEALLERAKEDLERAGSELTQQRRTAVPKLTKMVTEQLRDLSFRQAEFSIRLEPLPEAGACGFEQPEFLFAPNPGEPRLPLKSIASSGEISRVLLAIKAALVDEDRVPILVFDEIDSNVGGEIATMVGTKIRNLAISKQVLCISHLPQVAALATTHFVVEKKVQDGRSRSFIRKVQSQDRVDELARMLGGKTASAAAHARSLLESTHDENPPLLYSRNPIK